MLPETRAATTVPVRSFTAFSYSSSPNHIALMSYLLLGDVRLATAPAVSLGKTEGARGGL